MLRTVCHTLDMCRQRQPGEWGPGDVEPPNEPEELKCNSRLDEVCTSFMLMWHHLRVNEDLVKTKVEVYRGEVHAPTSRHNVSNKNPPITDHIMSIRRPYWQFTLEFLNSAYLN